MRSRAAPLKWMHKTMRGGEWAIWGALAGQQLENAQLQALELNLDGVQDLGEALERLEQISGRVCCSSYERLLRLCSESAALPEARRVHSHIVRSGLDGDTFLGNLLIETYGKLGLVTEATAAFEKIREPNRFSHNLLVAVYCKHGLLEQAEVVVQLHKVDVVGWNTLLSANAKRGYLECLLRLFSEMPEKNVVSWNTVLTLQSDLNLEDEAKKTFDSMPEHDVVSWNLLLQAFSSTGDQIFEIMPERDPVSWLNLLSCLLESSEPDAGFERIGSVFHVMPQWSSGALTVMIQALGQDEQLASAWSLFDSIPEKELASWNSIMAATAQVSGQLASVRQCFFAMPAWDVVSWNTLLTSFSSHSLLRETKQTFDQMPERDAVSWSILIQAHSRSTEILPFFRRAPQTSSSAWDRVSAALMRSGDTKSARAMFDHRVAPHRSLASWTSLLQSYSEAGEMAEAEQLLNAIPCADLVVWSIMICGYARCGRLEEALSLLGALPESDGVAWNSLLQALSEAGRCQESLALFAAMPSGCRSIISWSILLGAWARSGRREMAAAVFRRMPGTDLIACNAMLVCLAGAGALDEARCLVQWMRERSALSWTILIAAYVRHGLSKEALEIYGSMDLEACQPHKQTYRWIVAACSNRLDLAQGKLVHSEVLVQQELSRAVSLASALIEMYGRCGELEQARLIFDGMPWRNSGCWNSMLVAYAHHGHGAEALVLFRVMALAGFTPNAHSFITLLSACSHCGLISSAWECFAGMISSDYGPGVADELVCAEHYSCLVDAMGRAGMMEQAEQLMGALPVAPNRVAWTTFLGACNAQGDSGRGAMAASQLAYIDPSDASPYVGLSNLHKSIAREDFKFEST